MDTLFRIKEKETIAYIINADIVDLDGRVLHSNSDDIIILRVECKESCSRRRCHESSHNLSEIPDPSFSVRDWQWCDHGITLFYQKLSAANYNYHRLRDIYETNKIMVWH